MTVPKLLSDLDAEVTRAKGAMASASTLLRGVTTRIQAAVDKALENGATADELQPVQAEIDALKTATDDLSAAVDENA